MLLELWFTRRLAARDSRQKTLCDFADVCCPLSDIRCLMSEDCCLHVCLSVRYLPFWWLISDLCCSMSAPLFAVCCLTSRDIFCLMSAVCCLHIFDMLCLLSAGCCRLSDASYLMPDVCCMSVDNYVMSTICPLLSDVSYLMPDLYCLLPAVWCLLSAVSVSFDIFCLLSAICCLMPLNWCRMSAVYVCCLVSAVCMSHDSDVCCIHALRLMLNGGEFCL